MLAAWNVKCSMQFYEQLQVRGKLCLSFLPIIYHKHQCMMSGNRPHKEVTVYCWLVTAVYNWKYVW